MHPAWPAYFAKTLDFHCIWLGYPSTNFRRRCIINRLERLAATRAAAPMSRSRARGKEY